MNPVDERAMLRNALQQLCDAAGDSIESYGPSNSDVVTELAEARGWAKAILSITKGDSK